MILQELRVHMREWLADDTIKPKLRHYVETFDSDKEQEALDETAEMFGAENGLTADELHNHIWNLWLDPEEWDLEEQRTLESHNEWEQYLCDDGYWTGWGKEAVFTRTPSFMQDFAGNSDQALVEYYCANPELAAKCNFREIIPINQLGDNFRLEVVTTPEDDKVIGWVIIVD